MKIVAGLEVPGEGIERVVERAALQCLEFARDRHAGNAANGKPARACLTLAVQVESCEVKTVESLADKQGRLGVLQSAFRRNHALQCGFCTAGILMSLDALLPRHPEANEAEILDVLTGHLGRFTGYAPIV